MSRSDWLASLKGSVTDRELELLGRASGILEGNIVCDPKVQWYPFRGMVPSKDVFRGIWNWDSAFHAVGVCRWDPILAQEQFKTMFKFQRADGLLPDVVWQDSDKVEDEYGKPPVWAWAVEVIDKAYPDTEFLKYAYTRLIRYETFLRSSRKNGEDGLFYYSADRDCADRELKIDFESGWDNAVRWDNGIENLYTIDLNCYMVMFYRAMKYIALRLGFADDAEAFGREELALAERINRRLWDDKDGCYYDFDRKRGDFSRVLTPASFMPLFAGIADVERAKSMHGLAADPKKLFPGMPTVAYDDPGFCADYWRGTTWLNVAYFAAKGLYDYGFEQTAVAIRDKILEWVYPDDTIRENYDSTKPDGMNTSSHCARNFGWSAVFVIEFILNIR